MKTNLTTFCCLLLTIYSQAQSDMQLVIPTGHTRAVQAISMSENGELLASADFDPSIILWSYPERKQLLSLEGHEDRILDLNFYDSTLYSAGRDGKLIKWNIKMAEPAVTFDVDNEILALAGFESFIYGLSGDALYVLSAAELTLERRIDDFDHELTTLLLDQARGNILIGDTAGFVTKMAISDINEDKQASLQTVKVSDYEITTIVADPAGRYIVGDNRGQVTSITSDLTTNSVQQVMGLRVFDLLPADNDRLYVVGRDDTSPIKLLKLSKSKDEKVAFQMGAVDQGLLRLGIRCIERANDSTLIYTLPDGSFVSIFEGSELSFESWTGQTGPVRDIKILGDDLYFLPQSTYVRKIDLAGLRKPDSYIAAGRGVNSFDVDELKRRMTVVTGEDRIIVYDFANKEVTGEFDIKSRYNSTPVLFDPLARYIIRKNDSKSIEIFDYRNRSERKLKVENGFNFAFSFDGLTFFIQSSDGVQIYDVPSFEEKGIIKNGQVQHFTISDNRIYVLEKDDKTIRVYDWSGEQLNDFFLEQPIDKLVFQPADGSLLGYRVSYDIGSRKRDYNLYAIDSGTGKIRGVYPGHEGFIREVEFFRNGEFIFTGAADGKINIYRKDEFENPQASLVPLGESDYVVVTPSGLYDATPAAMKTLHYSKAGTIINLDQYKNTFYEPFLLPRILGIKDDPLPRKNIADVELHPEVEYKHPNLNNGRLGVNLRDQGGGIGRLVIIINGKEVSRESRKERMGDNLEFEYQISGHPYLKPAELNVVTIKAYNQDGTMSSPDKNLFVFPDEGEKVASPKLWAVVAGTSDYPGREMDLRFAAKDAADFAEALEISAINQFGTENINIALLTTDHENRAQWPYKQNIDSVFNRFSRQAAAGDYLVVYLSGHGLNENDFYYLTPAATEQEIGFLENKATISSDEITEMIKRVPALQQVLILDACHSGRFANELLQLKDPSTMNIDQVKALERIKDRTGLYVLAGSKADAVSYEAELYEQGLLTYSILFGMKGAALKAGEDVDIMDLFQFVEGKVPELAQDIGGIQKPELRYPNNASSFSIGKMTEADKKKIEIVSTKPIVLLSNFQEENTIADPLNFAQKVNKTLRESEFEGKEFVFLDKERFEGAYKIWGRYRTENDKIIAKIRIFRGAGLVETFEVSGVSSTTMSEDIVSHLVNRLD